MKNFWTNKIDKALRKLGLDPRYIDQLSEDEKHHILLENYLLSITDSGYGDCFIPDSVEEIAEYIIGRNK